MHQGSSFFRGSAAIIFMFDLTNKQSFRNGVSWKERVCPGAPFVVVGTKSDLVNNRIVQMEDVHAEPWAVPYVEISAKQNIGVEDAIEILLAQIQMQVAPPSVANNNPPPSLYPISSVIGQ